MPPLDLPLVPDEGYLEFLRAHRERVASLHFSLYSPAAADARVRLAELSALDLAALLGCVPGPRKFALLNSRFHAPEVLRASEAIRALLAELDVLLSAGVLDGLVYADHYLLAALSEASPALAAELEAMPSINLLLDSPARVLACLDVQAATRFRPPERIVLDRSLNRDPDRLQATARACRKVLPRVSIGLLANEGCLPSCPFKPAHDAMIAYAHTPGGRDASFELNRRFGCHRILSADPWRVLSSPFLRPEDAPSAGVDFIKLCGRNKGGAEFLIRAATAWMQGSFTGNILDLMDAMGDLAGLILVPNELMPPDFHAHVSRCDNHCASCGHCRALFERIGRVSTPALGPLLPRL